MLIRTVIVTPFTQFARVLIDPETKQATVVDPGGEVEKITPLLSGLKVQQIFLTHSHIDHAGGVNALQRWLTKTQGAAVPLIAHRAEAQLRKNLQQTALMFGLSPQDYENPPEPDVYADDGDTLQVGKYSGKLLFTPGHSPGHLSVYFAEGDYQLENSGQMRKVHAPVLIGGDVLFQGSIGRTDLPGGNHAQLLESVRTKIFTLPDATLVLSGHDEGAVVGTEKRTNPFFQ